MRKSSAKRLLVAKNGQTAMVSTDDFLLSLGGASMLMACIIRAQLEGQPILEAAATGLYGSYCAAIKGGASKAQAQEIMLGSFKAYGLDADIMPLKVD